MQERGQTGELRLSFPGNVNQFELSVFLVRFYMGCFVKAPLASRPSTFARVFLGCLIVIQTCLYSHHCHAGQSLPWTGAGGVGVERGTRFKWEERCLFLPVIVTGATGGSTMFGKKED